MAFEKKQDDRLVIGGFDIQIYDPVAQTITRYFTNGDHLPSAKPIAELRKLKLIGEISKPLPPAAKRKREHRTILRNRRTRNARPQYHRRKVNPRRRLQ